MTESLRETAEYRRLADSEARVADWKHWGPYVSNRAWGTVREDYSASGDPWTYFPHDQARSRAYRWNEDGIAGLSNRYQNLCLAVAFWNEQDPILKERFFGLSAREGNHGEDVKEYYFYIDNTPTHSYMKMLYRYPQVEYPYRLLVEENRRRGRMAPEFELLDALPRCFEERRYFDIFIEYAKADQEDILCRITALNRGPEAAPLHILPHLWARNTWSWGYNPARPDIHRLEAPRPDVAAVYVNERHLAEQWWYVGIPDSQRPPDLLFTENDTNHERLFGISLPTPYVKDSINDAVVHGRTDLVNPRGRGTKVAAHDRRLVQPGEAFVVQARFTWHPFEHPFENFDAVFEQRSAEADEFYAAVHPEGLGEEQRRVQRQALGGLMWTKQFYHYSVELWLEGDPAQPEPPETREDGRNSDWTHLYNLDVHAVPDKWEFPWYAAWDSAFHTLPIAMIDPEWARRQLILLLREWYMHPNGQLPAYEFAFGDVNPPVHAWAAWRVYRIVEEVTGERDRVFLEKAFHKLLLNFTWWVNQKDKDGNNIFQGGFLGLDNISVFSRSEALPTGGYIEQADGTAWMAMYCLNMLTIALELAREKPAYEDVATKFFEHFVYIAHSLTHLGANGKASLWNPEDGFFYDMLHMPGGRYVPLKVRSVVGLIPLFAVETLGTELMHELPRFWERMQWFLKYRPHLVENLASLTQPGEEERRLLALASREKLRRVLQRMLDPEEFLSPWGLRSLSKYHEKHPYSFTANGETHTVRYEPGVTSTQILGGNSNWRGPLWFPMNYLMIESLRKYHEYYGDSFKVELPTGSGNWLNLDALATELGRRLVRLFLPDEDGRRPIFNGRELMQQDHLWHDYLLFHEYFHGETGEGLGASHQTGWTALVSRLVWECEGRGLKNRALGEESDK